ncbi:hypothetical protein SAMN02745121_09118 [Nannocystis exedens]|uniref:Uncharacterized protein n=1 Tax=Nannocystis exedens TaxID=54 RepID=A0A1I2J3Y7_9BACT|nr:hypothetical protein [Nannocystis exedens]PCC67173.1 hypothetical protein NAEX_00176 [Nannocystis exedens]SFF47957.1 hypothetical protein SAMN02745121_09118 [Nannocystis exedens]
MPPHDASTRQRPHNAPGQPLTTHRHGATIRRLGLACLLALAACGARTKEPPPATHNQGASGAPAPQDTRTNPRPEGQPANSPTPGSVAGAANPDTQITPKPGQEPPGGAAGHASPDAEKRTSAGEPPPAKGQAN